MGCGCNSNFDGVSEIDLEFSNFNIQDRLNKSVENAFNDKEKLEKLLSVFKTNISKGNVYSAKELPFFKSLILKIETRLDELNKKENIKSSFFQKNKITLLALAVGVSVFIGYKLYVKYKK